MKDIYEFAYRRTRETIVPRHSRNSIPLHWRGTFDLVGTMGLTPGRLSYAAGARNQPSVQYERSAE